MASSAQDWAQTAVTGRAALAINDIVDIYTKRALDEGVQIPNTRELIVADAYARNWVKTATQLAADDQAALELPMPLSKIKTASITDNAITPNQMASFHGRRNSIINGGFQVWQYGSSHSSQGYGSADRWFLNLSGGTARQVGNRLPMARLTFLANRFIT